MKKLASKKIASFYLDDILIKSHSKHGTGFYENIVDEFKLQKSLKHKLTLTSENGRIEKVNIMCYMIYQILLIKKIGPQ